MTGLIIIGLIIAAAAYYFLLHDDLMLKRKKALELLESKSEAEKIAKVRVLSTDSKEIEKFILNNASTLSEATIDILVNRMEMLAADRVIRDDDLKARIDGSAIPKEWSPQVPDQIEVVEEPVKRKRK